MKLFVSNNIPGVGEVVAPEISDCSSIRIQRNSLMVQNGLDNTDLNSYSIQYGQSKYFLYKNHKKKKKKKKKNYYYQYIIQSI